MVLINTRIFLFARQKITQNSRRINQRTVTASESANSGNSMRYWAPPIVALRVSKDSDVHFRPNASRSRIVSNKTIWIMGDSDLTRVSTFAIPQVVDRRRRCRVNRGRKPVDLTIAFHGTAPISDAENPHSHLSRRAWILWSSSSRWLNVTVACSIRSLMICLPVFS